MKKDLAVLAKQAEKQINQASTEEDLEKVKIEYLGRKGGKLNGVLKGLKKLSITLFGVF